MLRKAFTSLASLVSNFSKHLVGPCDWCKGGCTSYPYWHKSSSYPYSQHSQWMTKPSILISSTLGSSCALHYGAQECLPHQAQVQLKKHIQIIHNLGYFLGFHKKIPFLFYIFIFRLKSTSYIIDLSKCLHSLVLHNKLMN